ncbi:MAG TPA: hypothetical protein DCZ12_04455 [Gammaproteobacteria bacterium]|nr:hypothetical protein [Gammaproteobacteria bacterium]
MVLGRKSEKRISAEIQGTGLRGLKTVEIGTITETIGGIDRHARLMIRAISRQAQRMETDIARKSNGTEKGAIVQIVRAGQSVHQTDLRGIMIRWPCQQTHHLRRPPIRVWMCR